MKTLNFEFLSNLIIAFLAIMLFTNPDSPQILGVLIITIAFFSAIRWHFHYKHFRALLKDAAMKIENLNDSAKARDNHIDALDLNLEYYKGKAKERWNENVLLQGALLRIKNPELVVLTEEPNFDQIHFKLHQGNDAKWYYSLIGLVGKKRKYLHNSRGYDTYAIAANAILEFVSEGHNYPVFDEMHCLTDDILTKETFASVN